MKKTKIFLSIFAVIGLLLMACEPKVESGLELGPVPTADQISFTLEPGSDAYHYILTNTTSTAGIAYWDFGNGKTASGDIVEVHYPDVDIYTITMTYVTSGGSASKTMEHVQDVADPLYGNLVKGGKFANSDDHAKWTVLPMNGGLWTFNEGNATLTAGGWNQAAIYQAIDVIADQTYSVDMLASSTSGVQNTWFEVYVDHTDPATVSGDYNAGGMKRSINTWDGCGGSPFSGLISEIGCKASNNLGLVTATQNGPIYLVIRGGGEWLKDGIAITNVELRAYYGE